MFTKLVHRFIYGKFKATTLVSLFSEVHESALIMIKPRLKCVLLIGFLIFTTYFC